MRLFVALDIDDAIRSRIARFLEGVREFVPDARWVRPESWHVTLKFIGEKSEEDAEKIKRQLATIVAHSFEVTLRGYGFFPGARAPRVFFVGTEASPALSALASAVDETLSQLGIVKEQHPFTPHLTLARGGGRAGSPRRQKDDRSNRSFQRLQEKLAALSPPEFGTMTARAFFLYQSHTSPGGAKYTKLAPFVLH
jgi:2'-5' RNA ligase